VAFIKPLCIPVGRYKGILILISQPSYTTTQHFPGDATFIKSLFIPWGRDKGVFTPQSSLRSAQHLPGDAPFI